MKKPVEIPPTIARPTLSAPPPMVAQVFGSLMTPTTQL